MKQIAVGMRMEFKRNDSDSSPAIKLQCKTDTLKAARALVFGRK